MFYPDDTVLCNDEACQWEGEGRELVEDGLTKDCCPNCLDNDISLVCPFCGDGDSVDEDARYCSYCRELF